MRHYTYYPGCSSHSTSRAYDESIKAIAPMLELELKELDDWNCCGATAYMSVNEILAFCMTARNLSLAAKEKSEVCTPCSACYLNLRKVNVYMNEFPELKEKVNQALAEAGMHYDGNVPTKHLLDVVVHDVGLEHVKSLVKKPLKDLKVAPYYGCQIVRPLTDGKDPENPDSLENLLEALGATPTKYPLKTWCCGGSLMGTQEKVALRLCRNLLLCAEQNGADAIAVTCPLCQFNLDVYQKKINQIYDHNFQIPIIYFTQLMGMAFDVPNKQLGLKRGVAPMSKELKRKLEVRA